MIWYNILTRTYKKKDDKSIKKPHKNVRIFDSI